MLLSTQAVFIETSAQTNKKKHAKKKIAGGTRSAKKKKKEKGFFFLEVGCGVNAGARTREELELGGDYVPDEH